MNVINLYTSANFHYSLLKNIDVKGLDLYNYQR